MNVYSIFDFKDVNAELAVDFKLEKDYYTGYLFACRNNLFLNVLAYTHKRNTNNTHPFIYSLDNLWSKLIHLPLTIQNEEQLIKDSNCPQNSKYTYFILKQQYKRALKDLPGEY